MLALCLLFWGSAFPAIRASLSAYLPGHLALLRFLVASAALAVCACVRSVRVPRLKDMPGIFLLGLVGIAIYHLALNYGEVTVTAGAAGFLIGSCPVFATLFSMALLGERPGIGVWLGIAVSFGGVTLIALGGGGGLRFTAGALLVLLAAAAGGLFCVIQKRYLDKYSPIELTSYAVWIGTLLLCVFLPGLFRCVGSAPLGATLSVVYLGVFPAAFAYIAWAYIQSHMSVSRVTSFLYLVPVISVVIARIWLEETPSPLSLAGGLLALSGVILVHRPLLPIFGNGSWGDKKRRENGRGRL